MGWGGGVLTASATCRAHAAPPHTTHSYPAPPTRQGGLGNSTTGTRKPRRRSQPPATHIVVDDVSWRGAGRADLHRGALFCAGPGSAAPCPWLGHLAQATGGARARCLCGAHAIPTITTHTPAGR
jgi:hypothetical protein